MIAFHFACYSAGTPRWDTFAPRDDREISPAPFLANLPLGLLRQGRAGVAGDRKGEPERRGSQEAVEAEAFHLESPKAEGLIGGPADRS